MAELHDALAAAEAGRQPKRQPPSVVAGTLRDVADGCAYWGDVLIALAAWAVRRMEATHA